MIYFDTNTITDVPQNASNSGFNNWPLKYKPDRDGTNLLASLGITSATEWSYADLVSQVSALPELSATLTGGIYTDILFSLESQGELTQTQNIKLHRVCKRGLEQGIYIKWVNQNGGWSYELFADKIEQNIKGSNIITAENVVSDLFTTNKKAYNINGDSSKTTKVIKSHIPREYIDRYNDLKTKALINNIWIYTRKYFGEVEISDYSSTKVGTVKCTSIAHGQKSGDYIKILSGTYAGTYLVNRIDSNNFYIFATYSTNSDTYFNRIAQTQDWQLCEVGNFNMSEVSINTLFSISFDIKHPSFGA